MCRSFVPSFLGFAHPSTLNADLFYHRYFALDHDKVVDVMVLEFTRRMLLREHTLWSSKRHPVLSRSSVEVEYRGVANAIAKTQFICPAIRFSTKHIEIDIHFVRDLVDAGQLRVLHVPSRYQFANIFTKGLPSALFEEFCTSLSVWCPSAPTAGEC
ncbi:ribonuclease H-like domain-containing protein, partial [Tanacetum coccineum]